jgi:hypothetical protein
MQVVIMCSLSTVQDCRTLLEPDNGRVSQEGNDFGDTATYECDDNFMLDPVESTTRTCMANDWSGEDPSCGMHQHIYRQDYT